MTTKPITPYKVANLASNEMKYETVKEVSMQRVEADAVALQGRGESMLRDQKINEEVDPLTEQPPTLC